MTNRSAAAHGRAAAMLVLVFLSGSFLFACDEFPTEDEGDPVVGEVVVTPTSLALEVGDTARLAAVVRDTAGHVLDDWPVTWSSTAGSVASVDGAGLVTAQGEGSTVVKATASGEASGALSGGPSGSADVTVAAGVIPVASVVLEPGAPAAAVRTQLQFAARVYDADGVELTDRVVAWSTGDSTRALVDGTGRVFTVGAGPVEIRAESEGVRGTTQLTVLEADFPIRGLYTQFERRGWPSGYWSGDLVRQWDDYDALVGRTVAEEVSDQLDRIRALGVNTITFELRSADSGYDAATPSPPDCRVPEPLGLLWPTPRAAELDNLGALLDLVDSKGMSMMLRLVNTRMDAAYRTEADAWLRPILERIRFHPALQLVLFEGDERVIDADGDGTRESCGGQAEPALWLGPDAGPAQYVEWALGLGREVGVPHWKMSAQAMVGFYHIDSGYPSGPAADGGHLWYPPAVLKTILDRVGFSPADRTYALSLFQMRKCRYAGTGDCVDAAPEAWAEESLLRVLTTIGGENESRIIAVEMGAHSPVEAGWNSEQAVPSLVALMRKHGVDGGAFWRWVNYDDAEDLNATVATPVKVRGAAWSYTTVAERLMEAYGGP